ncbi:MAG: hypothetical protein RLZ10_2360 [Bacteroidota bacterium]|jgi:hypothetical protein
MAKAKKADTAKKTQITLEDLNALRNDLEKQTADKQVELSQRTYAVNFENAGNITKVLNHLNKDVAWSSKNAALLVNLNDNLKLEKTRLTLEVNLAKNEKRTLEEGFDSTVYLKAMDLNTLYQSLLSVQSTGVESARNYVRLLTNVGAQITEAMQAMAESNKEIQNLHVELAELDAKISEETTPQTEGVLEQI